jgi:hypothetical protein
MSAPRFDYARYVAVFNSGDDDALCAEFFHPDAVMLSAGRVVEGRDALRAFLAWAHDGVRETLAPVHVARDGDVLLAEVDITFTASRDWQDFPIAPLRAGQAVTAKFAAIYELRDERVARLKTFRWPAGQTG